VKVCDFHLPAWGGTATGSTDVSETFTAMPEALSNASCEHV